MKITYVDTSILVGMLFEEKDAHKWKRFLNAKDDTVSSALIEAELLAAAAREKVELALASTFLESVTLLHPDRSLKEEYAKIFSFGYIRGADACHLASALFLDPEAKTVSFLTADAQQRHIAAQLGFETPSL